MLLKGQEQRITRRLLSYWHECKNAEGELPLETLINPDDLHDIWDDCFLASVSFDAKHGYHFRYNYIGPSIVTVYGNDTIGADIQTSLLSPSREHITDIFETVVETKKPIIDESEFMTTQKVLVRYRQCVLPFGNAQNTVTCLLGGMRWGAF